MNTSKKIAILAAAALVLGLVAALPAWAEEKSERKLGWASVGEFSWVLTAGNSENSSWGLKDKTLYLWPSAALELNAGAVRAEATTITYIATGTGSNYDVDKEKDTSTSAENYYLNGRYDRKISERFFWYAGAGWSRNTPAGIQNRYEAAGGVGNIWHDTDRLKFRTDYALSYTIQDDVVDNPDAEDSFIGGRFSWNYLHKFGEVTTYGNDFIVNLNFNTMSDWRWDMTNWVAVSMSKTLALKVSLQWQYDADPALIQVNAYQDASASLVDLVNQGAVTTEAEKLDTIFTTSLVFKF